MNDQSLKRMTVAEYLPWAEARGGRCELIDGRPVKMPPETLGQIRVKLYVTLVLTELAEPSGLELHVLADGVTVPITAGTANEPDALVYPGPRRPGGIVEIPDPLIVVEVVSPTSGLRDRKRKGADYFSLPSIEHYLIVDPSDRGVLHVTRASQADEGLQFGEADIVDLTPPGLRLPVSCCFSRD